MGASLMLNGRISVKATFRLRGETESVSSRRGALKLHLSGRALPCRGRRGAS